MSDKKTGLPGEVDARAFLNAGSIADYLPESVGGRLRGFLRGDKAFDEDLGIQTLFKTYYRDMEMEGGGKMHDLVMDNPEVVLATYGRRYLGRDDITYADWYGHEGALVRQREEEAKMRLRLREAVMEDLMKRDVPADELGERATKELGPELKAEDTRELLELRAAFNRLRPDAEWLHKVAVEGAEAVQAAGRLSSEGGAEPGDMFVNAWLNAKSGETERVGEALTLAGQRRRELVAVLSSMPKEDRLFLYEMAAAGGGEAGTVKGREFVENASLSVFRGLLDVLGWQKNFFVDQDAREKRAKGLEVLDKIYIPKGPVSDSYARHPVTAERAVEQWWNYTHKGLANDPHFRPLTDEEKARIREEAAYEEAVFEIGRELRDFEEGTIDPIRGDNVVTEKMLFPALRMAPYMAQGAIPYAGIPLLFTSTAGMRQRELEDRGVPLEESMQLAVAAAAIEAPMEYIQGLVTLGAGKVPLLRKVFDMPAATFKKWALKFAGRGGAVLALENLTEAGQDIMPLVFQHYAAELNEAIPGVKWEKEMERYWGERVETFWALLPMVLIGVGAGGVKDFSYLKDRRMLKAAGLTEEAIGYIETAVDAETAAGLLRSMWDNPKLRDPGSAEAKAALKELSAALGAQAASAQANGGVATVRRRGDEFEVRDRRGKVLGRTSELEEAWKLKTLYDMPDELFAAEGETDNRVDPMSPGAQEWEDASGEQAIHDNAALDAVAHRFKGKDGAGGVTLRVVNRRGAAQLALADETGAGGAAEVAGEQGGQATPAGLAGFVGTFERAFGKRVVFFRASKEIKQNGFFLPWEANTIWVNADAPAPAQAIVGHEFSHSIKLQNPKLWEKARALVAEVTPMPDSYREGRGKDYDASRIEEEWVSDVLGQHFDNPSFWEKLRDVAKERGMETEFRGLVRAVLDWLDEFVSRFRRVLNRDADTTVLRAAEDLRDGLAEMLVDYVQQRPEGGYPGMAGVTARDSAMFESLADETPAEQLAAVRSKYEGTPQWMKAPNGKATRLTERQWLTVRTENFKKWFGDWENDSANASRVLDENGEPLVVWRADRKHLRAFASGLMSRNWGRTGLFDAWYFTDNKALADHDRRNHYKTAHTRGFFLNLRGPGEMDAQGAPGANFPAALDEARAAGGGGAIIRNATRPEQAAGGTELDVARWDAEDAYRTGVGEGGGAPRTLRTARPAEARRNTVYAVFSNTDIKSATHNTGEFDAGDERFFASTGSEPAAGGPVPVVAFKSGELRMPLDRANPKAALKWALDNLRGVAVNTRTGWEIAMTAKVFRHSYNHAKADLDKFRVVEMLPVFLRDGVVLERDIPYDGRQKGVVSSNVLYAPFSLDGETHVARVVLHRMALTGHRAYDVKSVQIKRTREALRSLGGENRLTDLAQAGSMPMNMGELAGLVKSAWPDAEIGDGPSFSTGSATAAGATPAAGGKAGGAKPATRWAREAWNWFYEKWVDDTGAVNRLARGVEAIRDTVRRLGVMARSKPEDTALLLEGIEDVAETVRDFLYEFRGGKLKDNMRTKLEGALVRLDALAEGLGGRVAAQKQTNREIFDAREALEEARADAEQAADEEARVEAEERKAAAEARLARAEAEQARRVAGHAKKTVTLAEAVFEARKLAGELGAMVPEAGSAAAFENQISRLRGSVPGVVATMLQDGMVDFSGRIVGPALMEAVKGLDAAGVRDFNRYLKAKRALAVWNDTKQPGRNPSVPKVEAERDVAQLESADFLRRAKIVYGFNQGLNNYAAQASRAMALGRDKIEAADPGFYVPLWREGNGPDGYDDVLAPDGGPTDRFGKPLTGDEAPRTLWEPLDALMKRAEIIVGRAHERHIWETARDMVESNPLLTGWLRKVSEEEMRKVREMGAALDEAQADAAEATAEQQAAESGERRAAEELRRAKVDTALAQHAADTARKTVLLAGDVFEQKKADARRHAREIGVLFDDVAVDGDYVYAREKGEWYAIRRELFEAMNSLHVVAGRFGTTVLAKAMREAAKGNRFGEKLAGSAIWSVEMLDRVAKAQTRLFRAGATGLRASFGLGTNIVRDFFTLNYNTRAQGAGRVKVLANWMQTMGMLAMDALSGGRLGGRAWRNHPVIKHGNLYKRLGMNFVGSLTFDSRKVEVLKRKIGLGGKLEWTKAASANLQNGWEYLLGVLQFPETAARVAEMKALQEGAGWDIDNLSQKQIAELVRAGKEVTVDFTRMGSWSRVVNRYVPFFASSIGGKKSAIDAFRRNPAAWIFTRGLVASVAALANWWRNKDEDFWAELSAGERQAYDFVKWGGEVLKIPRAFEVDTLFKGLAVEIADAIYREEPDRLREWLDSAFEEFTVVGSLDTGVNMDALPPVVREGISQVANYDFYWKNRIVSRRQAKLDAEKQYGPYTSHLAIRIGEITGRLSPRRVDHLVRGLFAGVGGDMMTLAGRGPEWDGADLPLVGGLMKEGDWEPSDFPIWGQAFMRRGGTEPSGSRTVDKLYKAFGEMIEEKDDMKARGERETGEFRRRFFGLSDAIKAVEAAGEARAESNSREERRAFSEVRLEIAREALWDLETDRIGENSGHYKAAAHRIQRGAGGEAR